MEFYLIFPLVMGVLFWCLLSLGAASDRQLREAMEEERQRARLENIDAYCTRAAVARGEWADELDPESVIGEALEIINGRR